MAEVLMFLQLGDFCKCFAAQRKPAGEQPKNNLKWKSMGTTAVRSNNYVNGLLLYFFIYTKKRFIDHPGQWKGPGTQLTFHFYDEE
jgi:hypothetical protein